MFLSWILIFVYSFTETHKHFKDPEINIWDILQSNNQRRQTFKNQHEPRSVVLLMFLSFHLFFFSSSSSGEGLSSSHLPPPRCSSVSSCDTSIPPQSPRISDLFRRLLPSPASSPQTTPALFRHGRHVSEPCPASPTPSLPALIPPSGHSSPGTPRRCSAPEGLWGGAGVPQVVVYPPEEEEVFRMEDKEDHLSHQDPHSHSGKYLSARCDFVFYTNLFTLFTL